MTIVTRDFGQVELQESEIIRFASPVFGFEGYQRFALLSDDAAGGGLLWMQSVEDPQVCFILLDPDEVGIDQYHPQLPAEVGELLKAEGQTKDLAVLVIAVVPDNFRDTTVNLKSPIVLNRQNKLAAQVILEADYPIRLRLFDGEEGTSC